MTSAPIVTNASPLIALQQIDHLDILQQLFDTILIPPAVALEISPTVTLPDWIKHQELAQPIGPRILSASLGPGESETISLALETKAKLAILDDRPARRLAQALHLSIIGTLGLLMAAKRHQILPTIKPYLDALLQHEFRVDTDLYKNVLIASGEDQPIN